MATIFILLIYLAFISLGLPDTLLGSAWPVMQPEFGAPLDAAGVVSMVVSGATIFSSLICVHVVRMIGTSKITALSVVLTAAGLLGYSQSPSYFWLLLLAVPLGLGAGAIDTCLNNYASLFLSSRHMNWMHCFYGLGAAAGPALMSLVIRSGQNWRTGYLIVGLIQSGIAIILILTLPIWKGRDYKGESHKDNAGNISDDSGKEQAPPPKMRPVIFIPGVLFSLLCFALFFSIEFGTGLWTPSYLVNYRGFFPEVAASTASFFYVCVMVGRFISGILSEKLSDRALIRLGAGFCIIGAFCMAMPLPYVFCYIALAFIGLGCAPIFPGMIHITPTRFGRADSPRIMGVQMASAYAGNIFLCPLIGVVAERFGIFTVPWTLLVLSVLIFSLSEYINRIVKKHPPKEQEPAA